MLSLFEIKFGDIECKRCGDEFFSDMATEEMNEHELCFNCITEHKRKFSDMTLKEFSETKRECSHFKI
jgi:hypothetical protein